MASWAISALLLVTVYLVVINDVQGQVRFPINANEKDICREKENDDKVFDEEKSYKKGRLVCEIECVYNVKSTGEETEQTEKSPNRQLCCPFGGVPTGRCKDGKCQRGLIMN